MNLIHLKTFENSTDAHLVLSKLDSEGIVATLHDENISNLMPIYNITTGGIKLMVEAEDFVRAQEIISEMEAQAYTDERGEVIKCPTCQSENFYPHFIRFKGKLGFLSGALSFLLGIYPFHFNTVRKCKECGTEF